jgi:hypothetical protein
MQRYDGQGTPVEHLEKCKNTVEDDTTRGMASSLYPYIGRNSRELVYRPGDAQRHYRMDNITTELCSNLLI